MSCRPQNSLLSLHHHHECGSFQMWLKNLCHCSQEEMDSTSSPLKFGWAPDVWTNGIRQKCYSATSKAQAEKVRMLPPGHLGIFTAGEAKHHKEVRVPETAMLEKSEVSILVANLSRAPSHEPVSTARHRSGPPRMFSPPESSDDHSPRCIIDLKPELPH